MLSEEHKNKLFVATLFFLSRCHKDGDELLNDIVTGDLDFAHHSRSNAPINGMAPFIFSQKCESNQTTFEH